MSTAWAHYPYGLPAAECGCESYSEHQGDHPVAANEECPDLMCLPCCEDAHCRDCHTIGPNGICGDCVQGVKDDRRYEEFRDSQGRGDDD